MNSIYLVVIAGCFFVLAYRLYASFIAARVLTLDDRNPTPAHTCFDGREYVPTNKWVLFGHHFAAIAGAGPLVGPVLAAQYGWGPGFMWILLGAVFAGAVQDMIILFASVRHRGQSISIIAGREIGPLAGLATSISILFIIVMVLAGLAVVVVNALFSNPWGTYTIFLTIPIAMLVGMYMNRWRPGAVGSGSLFGFILVLIAVFTGSLIPGSPISDWFDLSADTLKILLPVYGFLAATLPVWLLLAPRDYLSAYMKIGTIFALAAGIIIVRPWINMPFTTVFVAGGGPILPGPVWPYMFITIACGAISGFHALIGSGTTPKMIMMEKQVKMVAYGSMLVEGFVAVMALIAAGVLQVGDYFKINSTLAAYSKISSMFPAQNVDELSRLVGVDVAHRPGGAVSLAVGMASIFSAIGGVKHVMKFWYQFAIMFEALFILTIIDAGTRVARYIIQDIAGNYVYRPARDKNWLPGVIGGGAAVSAMWGYLLYNGSITTIWPMFGVANQLLGAIALAIGTVVILRISSRRSMALVSFLPFLFLTVTVLAAAVENIRIYLSYRTAIGNINAAFSVMIIILTILVIFDAGRQACRLLRQSPAPGLNTERYP